MTGQPISHYRVLEKIGEGGMGVVYKAEDTKLGRTVALKFLAAHLLNDAEAKQRFLREAKAAAALHHPNICTVHEIDEAEGKTFLAMAFLEGETLEDRIVRGPLPLDDALDIGRQLAEALQAAHAAGVVHRDMKPANVLISPEGRATIMDFGLARLAEASKLTKADQTIGTAAYMSPEQMQGAEVDHRTDIWALGCVLYEMVAGVRAYRGEYQQALAYEILNQQPEPLTAVRAGLPLELDFISGKCLSKDAAQRYRGAADVAVDLIALQQKLALSAVQLRSVAGMPPTPASAAHSRNPRAWLPWALFAVSAAALVAMLLLRGNVEKPRPVRLSLAPPEGYTFSDTASQGPPVISPDGSKLAFVADRSLWVRSLDADEPHRLPSTDDATYPFWSPDSQAIAFFAGAKLRIAPAGGGPVREVCDAPDGRGGAWRDDSVIVFAPGVYTPIYQVQAGGGEAVQVTALDDSRGEGSHRMPRFLPDGRFLFVTQYAEPDRDKLCIGRLTLRPEPTIVAAEDCFLRVDSRAWYVPALNPGGVGHLLYVYSGSLLAQPYDPKDLRFLGQAKLLESNVFNGGLRRAGDFSVSTNGILTFGSAGESFEPARLVWFDRNSGQLTQIREPGHYLGGLDLFPRSDAALVTSVSPTSMGRITRIDLDSGTSNDLVSDASSYLDGYAVASPDGEEIVFSRDGQGSNILVRRPARGVGAEEILTESAQKLYPSDWVGGKTPFVLYQLGARNSNSDVWLLPLNGEAPRPLIATDASELGAVVSPDGRWVAYVSDRTGRREVFVQSMDEPGGSSQISRDGGLAPRWRSDGRELYFLSFDSILYAASVRATRTFEVAPPQPLSEEPIFTAAEDATPYDVTADGSRFLGLAPVERERGPRLLTVVLNWQAALRESDP